MVREPDRRERDESMLEAVEKATTVERLDSIDQSRVKGINTKKLTEDQRRDSPTPSQRSAHNCSLGYKPRPHDALIDRVA